MSDELTAADIFKGQGETTTDEVELDYELLFERAEEVGNPLAVPLVAVLRGLRHVKAQRDAERALRQQAIHELARVTAQLDAARRTIAAQRAEARR